MFLSPAPQYFYSQSNFSTPLSLDLSLLPLDLVQWRFVGVLKFGFGKTDSATFQPLALFVQG